MSKSFTLNDLPTNERPRERLVQYGVDVLSTQELLSLILGRGTHGESVVVTSQKLLTHFGSLEQLQEASLEDLQLIKGIGKAKACQLLACFAVGKRLGIPLLPSPKQHTNFTTLIQSLQQKIAFSSKENFVVVSLDSRQKVIALDTVAVGIVDANLIHARETFEAAIRRHAVTVIICHNHPSGNQEPSDEDLRVTEHLMSAGEVLGIPVIDHIIITKNYYFSMQAEKSFDIPVK